MKKYLLPYLFLGCGALLTSTSCSAPAQKQLAQASQLGLEPRIDSLLAAMSTEEKMVHLTNNSFTRPIKVYAGRPKVQSIS